MFENGLADLVFEPPIDLHHVSGGLALLVGADRLSVILAPNRKGLLPFSIVKKVSAIPLVAQHQHLRVLGKTRFNHAQEMEDQITSNFYTAILTLDNRCNVEVQSQYWSGLANAFRRNSRETEALISSRINYQISQCRFRLERLSLAYRTTLFAVASNVKISNSESFSLTSDKFAAFIGSEYRSLLSELYGLRDALLGAAYRLRYECTDSFQVKKIKRLALQDDRPAGVLISRSMFSQDGDLLIERMSLYRSIALHCLGTTNPVFSDTYQICSSQGSMGDLTFLVYPLYDDIEKMKAIENCSSKGFLQKPSIEEAKRFMQVYPHLDGLEFCFDCFGRLLEISAAIGNDLDIEPEILTLTDKDILEAEVTNPDGSKVLVKRDPVSGKLVRS